LKGSKWVAVLLLTVIVLAVFTLPVALLTKSFVQGASNLATHLSERNLNIPPPSLKVKNVPIIGATLYQYWNRASMDLSEVLVQLGPHFEPVISWLFSNLAQLGIDLFMFLISILIALLFLVYDSYWLKFIEDLANRLSRKKGVELIQIASSTIRGVTQGILGVAILQSILAGISLLLAEVPGAGIWSFLVLILAIAQIPVILILAPIVIYMYFANGIWTAIGLLIWSVFINSLDTPLKGYLLGRGMTIPVPILLIGAIGGLVQSGVLGLFIGAIILALGYKIFLFWLYDVESP
jgi:predicted PurR-regulated permease PerM